MLPSCFSINCDTYRTQDECLAVIDCEWCQFDVHGNKLTSAFCTSQLLCFNGVLSSQSPYSENDEGSNILAIHVYNISQEQRSYTIFGPIGYAIIVLVFFIGCFIYFNRYNQNAQVHHEFYGDSVQDDNNGVPLSGLNLHYCQTIDEASCKNSGAGNRSGTHRIHIHSTNIFPYNMSSASSYHRPNNGESDHGYSTMTPHEDYNDHQSFTLVKPLLLIDKLHCKSDTISISTSISSPTNRHQQCHNSFMPTQMAQRDNNSLRHLKVSSKELSTFASSNKLLKQTDVQSCVTPTSDDLCRNLILAPVTVHRHMETNES